MPLTLSTCKTALWLSAIMYAFGDTLSIYLNVWLPFSSQNWRSVMLLSVLVTLHVIFTVLPSETMSGPCTISSPDTEIETSRKVWMGIGKSRENLHGAFWESISTTVPLPHFVWRVCFCFCFVLFFVLFCFVLFFYLFILRVWLICIN